MRIKNADTTQKVSFVAVDATDGFTRETAIASWTVYYSLNGGTATAMTTPTVAELDATNMPGVYVLTVDESGMVSAKGELTLHITATGVAPITRVIEITDNFESDIYTRIGAPAGASIAADLVTIDDFLDTEIAAIKTKTDFLPSATAGSAGGVFIAGSNAATSVTTAFTANITGNLSGSVGSVTGAVGSVTGAVGSVTAGVTVSTNNDKTGYALSSAGIQAIWDALTSALTTVGSIGKLIVDNLNATVSSRASQTSVDTIDDFLDTEVAAILADTNELQTDWADGGRLDLILDARASQASVNTIDDFVDTEIATIITDIAAVKSDTAAILLDTGTDGVVVPQAQADKVWSSTTRTLTSIGIKKNTQLANFEFFMVDSTDHITGKTGLTVTATRSIDGAAFGACANAVTEVANGIYKITLAAADLNGDVVTLKLTATGADTRMLTLITTA